MSPFDEAYVPHAPEPEDVSTAGTATDAPWRTLGVTLEEINPIQSMITQDESRYLHWLARTHYRGLGEIVDAGPLMGGSTYALASGLEHNSTVTNRRKRIHSYDLWIYWEGFKTDSHNSVIGETGLRQGDSLLPLFLQNTKRYEHSIQTYFGDISRRKWHGCPVEILFIDCAKSWTIHNHMVAQFFGCLIPNRSIVVQQDYHHYYCYWIHLVMEFFAPYFKRTHAIEGATVPFLLTKEIPRELLSVDYSRFFKKAEAIQLMDKAIANTTDVYKICVQAAKVRLLGEMQEFEQATELAQSLRQTPDWDSWMLYDIVKAEEELPPSLVYPGIADVSKIVGVSRLYNILHDNNTFYAAPRTKSAFDTTSAADCNRPDILRTQSLQEMQEQVGHVEPTTVLPGFEPHSTFYPVEQVAPQSAAVLSLLVA